MMRRSLLINITLLVGVGGFVAGTPGGERQQTMLAGGYDATVGADPSTPIQLFALPGNTCPYVQRTHMCLLELGIPFDVTEISGKPDWYLKINPRGKVPSIRVPASDYATIYESAICNEFLCDYYRSNNEEECTLMPDDPYARAEIRLLNDHCDSLGKAQFTYLMNKDEAKDEELRSAMEDALGVYEEALAKRRGQYLLGDDFTLADIHVFPFIQRLSVTHRHWKGYELSPERFPRLTGWIGACSERESARQSSMSEEKTISVYRKFVEADYSFGGLNKNK
mmetsp:Transcript_22584/g.51252  ORF Transcript_22584/g.51252 Transcript_22584/m.51252 type:complete len:281 (-) Transcript_22584:106-948(-)